MAESTTFNITIDDTAPQIVYAPLIPSSVSPSTDLGEGWLPYFNGSGFNTFPGEEASGESLHYTSRDDATLSIGFTGTAIYLYGLADNASFSIALDNIEMLSHLSAARALNASSDPSVQVLASFTGLPQADHILSLITRISNATSSNTSGSGGLVTFDRAVVTVSTELEGASVITKTINDTEMQFTGSWTFVEDPALVPCDNSCHITNRSGDQAQYTFQGSSVEVGGLTNASAGLFNVTLTSDSDPEIFEQQTLSGFSSFLTYTTLFYATSLNESVNYTLTVTNLENKTLALDGMNVTVLSGGNPVSSSTSSASSMLSSTGLPRSTVAAIVIACVLGLLFLVAIIAYVLWTRRRRRSWWEGSEEMRYSSGRTVSTGPRHRRVRSADTVDVLHVHPGQGLSVPASVGVGYDYRSITGDENILEIGPSPDGDSDSGHGHEQGHKKSTSASSFDNLPRDRPMSASPTGRSTRHRSLNLGRWSGWFGSQHRSSFQSTTNRESFIPDIQIVAPRPTRAIRPVSLLARAHVRDTQSRRSSSAANLETGEGFLDVRRTSPFEVDFPKERSDEQPPASSANVSPRSQPRDVLVSFLDVASSAASSIRGSSRSRRQRSGSNKSSSQNGNSRRISRRSQNSSGYQSTSTGVWSLSLSIDPQPRRQRHSEEPVPVTAVEPGEPSRHPFSASSGEVPAASQDSPTDSLPMSVSDINFRVDEEDEDAAEAGGRIRLPRHPPLPSTPLSFTFSSDRHGPEISIPSHSRQMSTASGASGDMYVAQTPLGRRLAEARAQAHNAQGNRSYATLPPVPLPPLPPSTPTGSERRVRLLGNRARSLPFLNLSRSHNGSS